MITDRYKLLLAVVEEKSISAAAQALGYTPSGVSRMIATLEEEAGVKLFIRNKSGVIPTDECMELLQPARKIVYYQEMYDQMASEFRGLDKGSLTIGTSYSSYYRWLSQLIAEFNKKYPHIDVKLVQKNSTLLTQAVISHETDIGIVSRREGDVDWTQLRCDPMMAWVPKDSHYVEQGYVPVEDFAFEPYINPFPDEDTDTKRVLDMFGITPTVKYSVNDTYAAVCLVEAGLGIALMNDLDRRNWEDQIGIVPIKPTVNIDIGIISTRQNSLSPAARKFIEFIKDNI